MSELVEFLRNFVAPPILGLIGGAFSPWIRSLFDERKERNKERRLRIENWRKKLLSEDIFFDEDGSIHPAYSYENLVRVPEFQTLKPHLSKASLDELQKYMNSAKPGALTLYARMEPAPTENAAMNIISKEISRIEKEWKLI